jgi:hypothetical protein
MVHGSKARFLKSKLVNEETILISRFVLRVEFFVVIWFIYVELVRANSNNWT